MKKRLFVLHVIVFSIILTALLWGETDGWQHAKGITYYMVNDLDRGKVVDLTYDLPNKGANFSVIVVAKGTGNLDIDAALYDAKGTKVATDTSPEPIAVVAYTFVEAGKVGIKITCNSGRGKAVVYADETDKLLKILTRNFLYQ